MSDVCEACLIKGANIVGLKAKLARLVELWDVREADRLSFDASGNFDKSRAAFTAAIEDARGIREPA